MNPTVAGVLAVVVASTLDGVLAGGGVKRKLATLRQPSLSPPFALWAAIQWFYYGLCFAAAYTLISAHARMPRGNAAGILLVALMGSNALWNFTFFRQRNLHRSWWTSVAYLGIVLLLCASLLSIDVRLGALLFVYGLILAFGTWWAYSVWQLNK